MGGRVRGPPHKLGFYRGGPGGQGRTRAPINEQKRGNEAQAQGPLLWAAPAAAWRVRGAARFFGSLRESAACSLLKDQVLAHWGLAAGVEVGGLLWSIEGHVNGSKAHLRLRKA